MCGWKMMRASRPEPRAPRAQTGFTLIEMLVALAIFSLVALAMLNLMGQNLRTAAILEESVLASIIAENRAVEALVATALPAAGIESGEEELGGHRWQWERTTRPTDRAEIFRVDIRVRLEGREQVAAQTSLFRGTK